MGMKYRMGQERAVAFQFRGQCVARIGFDGGVTQLAAERAPYGLHRRSRRGLVQRDTERARADPQVDFSGPGAGGDLVSPDAAVNRHRVEERVGLRRESELAQSRRQHRGAAMHVTGDVS